MTAFYDFFRKVKLFSPDGTLLNTIEADSVTDSIEFMAGEGVRWNNVNDSTVDGFIFDVKYDFDVPPSTTTLRLSDVNGNNKDIALVPGGNMTITRDNSGQLTIAALVGGVSKSISNITKTNPVRVTTTNDHNFTEGTPVTIVDVVGMTNVNGNEYFMNVIDGTNFDLYSDEQLTTTVNGTGFSNYTSGGVATADYGGAKQVFKIIRVAGQTDVVADNLADILTLTETNGLTISTTPATDTIDFAFSGGLDNLSDVKFTGTNFTDSLMIGHTTTGTLNNAHSNILIGKDTAKTLTSGIRNTVIGHQAGDSLTTGEKNTLIGYQAGDSITTGDGNVIIGDYASGTNSNNTTAIYTGDGTQRLYIGNSNHTLDGNALTGQYYSNIWHHSTQVGAFRAQGESGATTVTNPPYETTYLERAYITIDATNHPVTHRPARIHVGGGHLALHGGDGLKKSTSTIIEKDGTWAANGSRVAGTYTNVAHDAGKGWAFNGTPPTFTVVVAVGGAITSVTPESNGSGIYFFSSTEYFEIADSSLGSGGAPTIRCAIDTDYTTEAKLTAIGDVTVAFTPSTNGVNLNGDEITTAGITQTLTNKTINSPVINSPTGDVVTKTGAQTLTNKTITSPSIGGATMTADLLLDYSSIATTIASAGSISTVGGAPSLVGDTGNVVLDGDNGVEFKKAGASQVKVLDGKVSFEDSNSLEWTNLTSTFEYTINPPASIAAARTLTLPDASGTVAVSATSPVTLSVAGDIGLGTVPIAKGGTGATDAAGARTALGLATGSDIQVYDADLEAIAGLTSAADKGIIFTGSGTAGTFDFVANGRSWVALATASDQRDALDLNTTDDVQFDSLGVGTAASGTTGEIRATDNITGYYSSDSRLKENIINIPDALDKVSMLKGVMFDWTDEHIKERGGEDGYFVKKRDTGLIAQDVQHILPEIVRKKKDGYLGIQYDKIVGLLVESIKELKAEVEELKSKKG